MRCWSSDGPGALSTLGVGGWFGCAVRVTAWRLRASALARLESGPAVSSDLGPLHRVLPSLHFSERIFQFSMSSIGSVDELPVAGPVISRPFSVSC